MKQQNKFTKSLAQFYLPPEKLTFRNVDQSCFAYHSRSYRLRRVKAVKQKQDQREQKSLINFQLLSKVFQANQKVFRSSMSFTNPQQICMLKAYNSKGNKKRFESNRLLKEQILKRQFQEQKKRQYTSRYSGLTNHESKQTLQGGYDGKLNDRSASLHNNLENHQISTYKFYDMQLVKKKSLVLNVDKKSQTNPNKTPLPSLLLSHGKTVNQKQKVEK